MSKQLVEAWFRAKPVTTVTFRDSSWASIGEESEVIVVKFTFHVNFCDGGYEWWYEFDHMDRTDARESYMESISAYMEDTLGVTKEDYGYPQIFQMVINERGELKNANM
jgi:hypothetical protein